MERLYDLLFEVSNEYRHSILLQLVERPMRVTDLSRQMDLTSQEISRHVSRLDEVGLTHKDVEGFHHLSHYGELVLEQLEELEFISRHREYFTEHTLRRLPKGFVKRLGDLRESTFIHGVMDFLQFIERIIREAEGDIRFMVDQYPMTAMASIGEALDRGVVFRCIEPDEGITGPKIGPREFEETSGLKRARSTPLVEMRSLGSIDVYLFVSEKMCALAFPTGHGEFDYRGFTAKDEVSVGWCRELFEHHWERAKPRPPVSTKGYLRPEFTLGRGVGGTIVVEGLDDPAVDAHRVQDAVDNYDEVILKGTFNFQNFSVRVSRSVAIRGEGRENDTPLTKIHKDDWAFPFTHVHHVFNVEGDDIDVTIENIHFTDFNYLCICGTEGNSISIRRNRITLETGMWRAFSNLVFGDSIIGIGILGAFPGGVTIEGNYLDYALNHLYGGYFPPGLKGDPYYRPDLLNHEYYSGLGIYVRDAAGRVAIERNKLYNMNARAISVSGSKTSTEVTVKDNEITSRIYGSYWMDRRWAGAGIVAHTSWNEPQPGFYLEIVGNNIDIDKPRYCGIMIWGPYTSPEGSGKLRDGIVKDNKIRLEEGAVCILAESCDGFEIAGNALSGEAYHGIGFFPHSDPKRSNLGASENTVEGNRTGDLAIKGADEYSSGLFDDKSYAASKAGKVTAHVFLNPNTRGNLVKVSIGETVIDEGDGNTVLTGPR